MAIKKHKMAVSLALMQLFQLCKFCGHPWHSLTVPRCLPDHDWIRRCQSFDPQSWYTFSETVSSPQDPKRVQLVFPGFKIHKKRVWDQRIWLQVSRHQMDSCSMATGPLKSSTIFRLWVEDTIQTRQRHNSCSMFSQIVLLVFGQRSLINCQQVLIVRCEQTFTRSYP